MPSFCTIGPVQVPEMADESEVVAEMARKSFASSSNYERVRPDYSLEAVEFFLRKLGLGENSSTAAENQIDRSFTILEVGCGTGKFTRVMLEVLKGKNVKVIASEPLQSMCEEFKLMVPDAEIIQCPAEKITLPDASVDIVIAAQSFHWFTNRAALEEFHRVLVPKGSFGMVWNTLDHFANSWLTELIDFVQSLDEENGLLFPSQKEWRNVFTHLSKGLFSNPEECTDFKHSMTSSFDHAFKLISSFSEIAGGSDDKKKEFHDLFNDVTKRHFKDKGIALETLPFKFFMYWCTKEN